MEFESWYQDLIRIAKAKYGIDVVASKEAYKDYFDENCTPCEALASDFTYAL